MDFQWYGNCNGHRRLSHGPDSRTARRNAPNQRSRITKTPFAALAADGRKREFSWCVPVEHFEGDQLVRSKLFSVFLLAVLLLPVPGEAQSPNAYFSLSTSKTFLHGEKVGIRVYSTNVEALEFRV